jgi:hypothetical protein
VGQTLVPESQKEHAPLELGCHHFQQASQSNHRLGRKTLGPDSTDGTKTESPRHGTILQNILQTILWTEEIRNMTHSYAAATNGKEIMSGARAMSPTPPTAAKGWSNWKPTYVPKEEEEMPESSRARLPTPNADKVPMMRARNE